MILYKESVDDAYNIILLNLEANKSSSLAVFDNVQVTNYALLDEGKKIILFPHYGSGGNFEIYDVKTGTKEYKKIDLPGSSDNIIEHYSVTDSLIVFNNSSDIFFKKWQSFSKMDSIDLNAVLIGSIECSNYNILAVLYETDSSNINEYGFHNTFQYNSFLLVDLNNKTRIRLSIIPSWIGNWSPDGKYLLCSDSVQIYSMEYPSLKRHELEGLYQDSIKYYNVKFLDNNTIVFNGITSSDPNLQVYIYDMGEKIIRKLTDTASSKELLDTYSKE